MSWTPEKETKLRELWKKGHSGSEIAKLLGDTTRNAVIGKAHRLKLESRTISKRTETNTNKQKNNLSEAKPQKLGRKARFKALLLDKNFEQENPIKLEELTDLTKQLLLVQSSAAMVGQANVIPEGVLLLLQ